MPKRRHLGPVYEKYPAAVIGGFLGETLYKIGMTLLCCIVWTGIYYVIMGVINFMKTEILEEGQGKSTARDLFYSEAGLWVLLGCYVVIFIIVVKSKTGSKSKVRRRQRS